MSDVDRQSHWDAVYRTTGADQVSWFEPTATVSLELIEHAVTDRDASIIDVGAGASTLVDGLVAAGYARLTLLDLSAAALACTRARLGATSDSITWREADVLSVDLPAASFHLWHDRAVFHFLVAPEDRACYVAQLRHAVRAGGYVLIATFAEDGPTRCSGLDVARYSSDDLQRAFGDDFHLVTTRRHVHRTPWGAEQAFTCSLFRYCPPELGE